MEIKGLKVNSDLGGGRQQTATHSFIPRHQSIDPYKMSFLATSHKSQHVAGNEEPVSAPLSSADKLKEFETVFPKLVKDLEDNAKQYNLPEESLKWYRDVRSPATSQPSSSISGLLNAVPPLKC